MTQHSALLGRDSEQAALNRILSAALSGTGGALVVRGVAGIGKSALLDAVVAELDGWRVVRVSGTESEAELAYAGLHQLYAQLPFGIDELPAPQRLALGTALGLLDGDPPDSFLVGLAALTLISALAEEKPCAYVIDDAQWIDQVSRKVLGFVARRLEIDSVAMFFATREASRELSGLAEIQLDSLSSDQSRELLDRVVPKGIASQVRDTILEVSDGNPLAILELPRGISAVDLAGGVTFGGFTGKILPVEASFGRRISDLPADTQTLLLVAAADPEGSWDILIQASEYLGVGPTALIAAEREGLAQWAPTGATSAIQFRHPLVRSASYRGASSGRRREVHQALAAAYDLESTADRRAWHRALAAVGPDEEIAAELEASASTAAGRGGLAASAALIGQAVALTPDLARKDDRALRAAAASIAAGDLVGAKGLMESTEDERLSPFQLARKGQLDAQIGYALNPSRAAVEDLIAAASRLIPFDANSARDTYLEALIAAIYQTSSEGITGWVEIARSMRALLDHSKPLAPDDLMLDGLTTTMIDGYEISAPILRNALDAYLSDELSREDALRWWQLGWWTAIELCDASYVLIVDRTVQFARELGSLAVLPFALLNQAVARTNTGNLDLADAACEEAMQIFASIGQPMVPFPAPIIAATRGSEFSGVGEGVYGVFAQYYSAMLLANGHARFEEGLAAARQALHHDAMGKYLVWLDVIEIASNCGDQKLIGAALTEARAQWIPSGSDFALGLLALCESFGAAPIDAESHFEEAINRLDAGAWRFQWARSHLLYGEWLKRERRRAEARDHLDTAHRAFRTMGAQAFAGRAERSLLAVGGTSHQEAAGPRGQLTSREDQVARLAAQRLTNVEIAAQLFISPATVDYHLRKVFQKLGVKSRRELESILQRQ
jgi:DNA-binding CsgD family transcriptional regulator